MNKKLKERIRYHLDRSASISILGEINLEFLKSKLKAEGLKLPPDSSLKRFLKKLYGSTIVGGLKIRTKQYLPQKTHTSYHTDESK